MFGDLGIDHFGPMRFQSRQRALFVEPHLMRVPGDIGGKDCGEVFIPAILRVADLR